MDEATASFLINNELERFLPVFEREEINSKVLETITESDLQTLLPSAPFGVKRKLILSRDEWMMKRKQARTSTPSLSPPENPIWSSLSPVIEGASSKNPIETATAGQSVNDNVSAGNLTALLNEYEKSESVVSDDDESHPNQEMREENDDNARQVEVPPIATPNYSALLDKETAKQILSILNKTSAGVALLSLTNSRLDSGQRQKLCQLIIDSELNGNLNTKISSRRFIRLSKGIATLFTKEDHKSYYVPYRRLPNKKKVNARGKLIGHYNNLRRTLIKLNLIQKYNAHSAPAPAAKDPVTEHEVDEKLLDELQWLTSAIDPASLVEERWTNTARLRLGELEDNPDDAQAVYTYMNKFPAIKRPSFKKLFDIDFKFKFADKENALFDSWPLIEEKIYALVAKKDRKFQQAVTKEGIHLSVPATDPRFRTVNGLLLLSRLLPIPRAIQGSIKKKKNELWRPSRIEVQNGFLLIADESRIDEALTLRRKKHEAYGVSIQPTVALAGEPQNLTSFFVYFCGIKYLVGSPLEAIDLCMKICFVLNLRYPAEAIYAYNFLQHFVFKVKLPNDEDSPPVITLGGDLGLNSD